MCRSELLALDRTVEMHPNAQHRVSLHGPMPMRRSNSCTHWQAGSLNSTTGYCATCQLALAYCWPPQKKLSIGSFLPWRLPAGCSAGTWPLFMLLLQQQRRDPNSCCCCCVLPSHPRPFMDFRDQITTSQYHSYVPGAGFH